MKHAHVHMLRRALGAGWCVTVDEQGVTHIGLLAKHYDDPESVSPVATVTDNPALREAGLPYLDVRQLGHPPRTVSAWAQVAPLLKNVGASGAW